MRALLALLVVLVGCGQSREKRLNLYEAEKRRMDGVSAEKAQVDRFRYLMESAVSYKQAGLPIPDLPDMAWCLEKLKDPAACDTWEEDINARYAKQAERVEAARKSLD